MVKHFDSMKAAIAELLSFGFKPIGSRYVKDRIVAEPVVVRLDCIRVFYREI